MVRSYNTNRLHHFFGTTDAVQTNKKQLVIQVDQAFESIGRVMGYIMQSLYNQDKCHYYGGPKPFSDDLEWFFFQMKEGNIEDTFVTINITSENLTQYSYDLFILLYILASDLLTFDHITSHLNIFISSEIFKIFLEESIKPNSQNHQLKETIENIKSTVQELESDIEKLLV